MQLKFQARAYEIGPAGTISPFALGNWLQEAAGQHAAALGADEIAALVEEGVVARS